MSDSNSPLGLSDRNRLAAEVGFLMLKGAGYAMILVLAIWFLIAVTAAIGNLLPERSREAQDPSPWSALEVIEPAQLQIEMV